MHVLENRPDASRISKLIEIQVKNKERFLTRRSTDGQKDAVTPSSSVIRLLGLVALKPIGRHRALP